MFRIICIAAAVVVLGLPVWANECKGLKSGTSSTIITPVCDVAPVAAGTFAALTLSVGGGVQTYTVSDESTGLKLAYAVNFLNGASINSSIGTNATKSGGSATTEFTTTGDAAIAWENYTYLGNSAGSDIWGTDHDPADAGKLAIYFVSARWLKNLSPDAASLVRGWKLHANPQGVASQLGSEAVISKVLTGGANDRLDLTVGSTSQARLLLSNASGEVYVQTGGVSAIPDPSPVLDATGASGNYLAISYVAPHNPWFPDGVPSGYSGLTSELDKKFWSHKYVSNASSENPGVWGTVPVTGRASIITLLVKEKSAAIGFLRTGTTASHLGAGIVMDESLTWGKTLDNGGFFVVKDGPISITSDFPSSAPEAVTGYEPLTDNSIEIIASNGTGTLSRHGIMRGEDMKVFGDAASTGQGFSSWQLNNGSGPYDPAKNISPTKSGGVPFSFANNTVIVKALSIETDPYVWSSPVGFDANNHGNGYRYNKVFVPIVHLTEEPREGLVMPPLIGWDQTNLYSIEPEPASPPASAYTWHHADLSLFDPANLPLKDNGNYDIAKEDLNRFLGAMNTWSMGGQKSRMNLGGLTQDFYYRDQGRAAANELKYMLGPDTLENKKSVIAAWIAYGLQGLSAIEYYRDNDEVGGFDYATTKSWVMGLVPAILLLRKVFPDDTALASRIETFMSQGVLGTVHAGRETGARQYITADAMQADDYRHDKNGLVGRYSVADIGKPDWMFLSNGYFPGSVGSASGHNWNAIYRYIDNDGQGVLNQLTSQFGGWDAFSVRPAAQAYEDRIYNLRKEVAEEQFRILRIKPVTSDFTVGETFTTASGGSGTITAIDKTVASTIIWSTDFTGSAIDGEAVASSGGAGTLAASDVRKFFGGVGGLMTRISSAVDDTTSIYATVIAADGTYTSYQGTPEQQPPPRLTTSGGTITITPSVFQGLNGGTFVRRDYRWQPLSANRLDDGTIGSEVNGDDPLNGAWTVQLDGGDTSFTTPVLAAGNYRVATRVVNNNGVGTWSYNWFYDDKGSDDHANDGMATITVR